MGEQSVKKQRRKAVKMARVLALVATTIFVLFILSGVMGDAANG